MRGDDLWFYHTSLDLPCINWYQSKYSEHSYDPTVLATKKIHRHDRAHKFNSRDTSHSLDHSKHVHKSCSKDERKSSSHFRHVQKSRDKDERKSSSHFKHVHKSQSRNENKSSSHSPHAHKRSRDEIIVPDEIPIPNFSQSLHLIELLQENKVAYMATQHAPTITNSELEISKEESAIPEMDKLHDSDYLSEDVHKDDSKDVSPQDLTPITRYLDTITPVTDVLSTGDPTPITSLPYIITSSPDGDEVLPSGYPTPIISPPDFISPIVDDQRVDVAHVHMILFGVMTYYIDKSFPLHLQEVCYVVNDLPPLFRSYHVVTVITSFKTSSKD